MKCARNVHDYHLKMTSASENKNGIPSLQHLWAFTVGALITILGWFLWNKPDNCGWGDATFISCVRANVNDSYNYRPYAVALIALGVGIVLFGIVHHNRTSTKNDDSIDYTMFE